MGLFDGTKRRHLNDLEREVLANPTPQNMVSLIERYMAAGDEAKALEMARKSVEKFPNSEKVQTTFQNVRRIQLQAEITEISKALRRSPASRSTSGWRRSITASWATAPRPSRRPWRAWPSSPRATAST